MADQEVDETEEDRKRGSKDLLIVEDLEDTVDGLTMELEYRSVHVHQATTRATASAMLRESSFAAVLVDLNIPASPGLQPSPENGRGLAVDMCSGVLGPLNVDTPFLIMTAQQIDLRPTDLSDYSNFLGTGSKVGDSRWLTRRLIQLGIAEERPELDLGVDAPHRERLQVLITNVTHETVTAEVLDLGLTNLRIPLVSFTPYLRSQLASGRKPIALWAVGNVDATTEDDVSLKEFTMSNEQINDGRDYTDVDWLRP